MVGGRQERGGRGMRGVAKRERRRLGIGASTRSGFMLSRGACTQHPPPLQHSTRIHNTSPCPALRPLAAIQCVGCHCLALKSLRRGSRADLLVPGSICPTCATSWRKIALVTASSRCLSTCLYISQASHRHTSYPLFQILSHCDRVFKVPLSVSLVSSCRS